MAVPKRKISKARKNQRRSHHALTSPNVIQCPKCKEPKQSHRACPSCGDYNGRQVVSVEE